MHSAAFSYKHAPEIRDTRVRAQDIVQHEFVLEEMGEIGSVFRRHETAPVLITAPCSVKL